MTHFLFVKNNKKWNLVVWIPLATLVWTSVSKNHNNLIKQWSPANSKTVEKFKVFNYSFLTTLSMQHLNSLAWTMAELCQLVWKKRLPSLCLLYSSDFTVQLSLSNWSWSTHILWMSSCIPTARIISFYVSIFLSWDVKEFIRNLTDWSPILYKGIRRQI